MVDGFNEQFEPPVALFSGQPREDYVDLVGSSDSLRIVLRRLLNVVASPETDPVNRRVLLLRFEVRLVPFGLHPTPFAGFDASAVRTFQPLAIAVTRGIAYWDPFTRPGTSDLPARCSPR